MTDLEKLKFYIVVPLAAINYITNPTPYRTTAGYAASGGSIEIDDTYTRRGPGSIKVTPTTSLSGVYFDTVSVISGQDYTFSVDVKGEAGKTMRIYIATTAGSALSTTTFTATGNWQRVSVTRTENSTTTRRLYVMRDATTGTNPFYVDGFQFEDGNEATTFFSGDTKGFGIAPLEFYWGGTPHASISYRTADTRAGGRLLDIEDYAYKIISSVGLGLGQFDQVYTELASGGAYYQKHIRKPRTFSLIVHYHGDNPGELHDARNALIEAITPDLTGYEQPLVIRYQGEDSSGDEATNPVDIICVPTSGHNSLPDEPINNRDVLTFLVLDGHLEGPYKEGVELSLYDTLTVGDYLVYRDANGVWHDVDNSGTGIGGNVYAIAEAPNGDIYIGGDFTNAGGVAEADYLCKLTTAGAIESVTGSADFNDIVWSLCVDADGNLYIGGNFTDAGDSNGDGIVMWNGSSLSSLGSGASGGILRDVACLIIDPDTGYLYAGGDFTSMGGVANTACIAYWDGSSWNALGSGIGGTPTLIYSLAYSPNGNLYMGGNFQNADGTNGDHICYWEGANFNAVGDTELNGGVYSILFDRNGYLYAGGTFTNAGGDANADYIAVFKNNAWQALGTGLNDICTYLYYDGSIIYASGTFTSAGGYVLSDRVAIWVNGAWEYIGIVPGGTGNIFQVYKTSKDNLFIGGAFSGTTYVNDSVRVTNNGNAQIYPAIEVEGPGVLQSITNHTTGKEIQFDGLTLQTGEIITLDFNPTDIEMTSTWGGRGNLLKYVNPGSDLGQFYLKPGDNYISLFMPSGTDSNTQAFIYWTPKFWNLEGSRYE